MKKLATISSEGFEIEAWAANAVLTLVDSGRINCKVRSMWAFVRHEHFLLIAFTRKLDWATFEDARMHFMDLGEFGVRKAGRKASGLAFSHNASDKFTI